MTEFIYQNLNIISVIFFLNIQFICQYENLFQNEVVILCLSKEGLILQIKNICDKLYVHNIELEIKKIY